MYCTHCGKELLDTDLVCPACGQPVKGMYAQGNVKEKIAKNKKWLFLFGGIGLAVIAALFISFKTPLLLSKDEKQILEFVEYIRQDFGNAKIQVQDAKLYYGKDGDFDENSEQPDADTVIGEIVFITDGSTNDPICCDDSLTVKNLKTNEEFLFSQAYVKKTGNEYMTVYLPKKATSDMTKEEQLRALGEQYIFEEFYSFCDENANEISEDSIARITRVTGQFIDLSE